MAITASTRGAASSRARRAAPSTPRCRRSLGTRGTRCTAAAAAAIGSRLMWLQIAASNRPPITARTDSTSVAYLPLRARSAKGEPIRNSHRLVEHNPRQRYDLRVRNIARQGGEQIAIVLRDSSPAPEGVREKYQYSRHSVSRSAPSRRPRPLPSAQHISSRSPAESPPPSTRASTPVVRREVAGLQDPPDVIADAVRLRVARATRLPRDPLADLDRLEHRAVAVPPAAHVVDLAAARRAGRTARSRRSGRRCGCCRAPACPCSRTPCRACPCTVQRIEVGEKPVQLACRSGSGP